MLEKLWETITETFPKLPIYLSFGKNLLELSVILRDNFLHCGYKKIYNSKKNKELSVSHHHNYWIQIVSAVQEKSKKIGGLHFSLGTSLAKRKSLKWTTRIISKTELSCPDKQNCGVGNSFSEKT